MSKKKTLCDDCKRRLICWRVEDEWSGDVSWLCLECWNIAFPE